MQTLQEFTEKFSRSISVKIAIIGFLILLLLIPGAMIQELIRERQITRDSVVQEVSDKWGRSQTISGPILALPYFEIQKNGEEENKVSKTFYVLPEALEITGQMNPEIRYRGIYKVIVYQSDIHLSGSIKLPDFSKYGILSEQIYWEKASLLTGISDLRGIQNEILLKLDNLTYAVESGIEYPGIASSGVTSKFHLDPVAGSYPFSMDLSLNGSENLYFIPAGKTTNVTIQSPWTSPSFTGSFLPDHHEISKSGFKANWNVLDLNRNFPQFWDNQTFNLFDSFFGVNLLFAVDEYQKSMRSAKYAFMFIALTFLIFLFAEIINKKRIHWVQYLLVGFALLLFYTLLLSFSEQVGFNLAYVISSAAIVGLITVYSQSMFKSFKLSAITFSLLVILYAFLFVILQMEDYSLLLGSIGLFIILGIVMYLSKRINWYGQINNEAK
jgi:inner membrane protein